MGCVSSTDGIPAGFQNWANVLAHGNITGGTNPTISAGDSIQGLGDIPFVTGGFTTTYANATGLWTYPASATYDSAAPTVTIGDASGNASLRIYGPNAQATIGSGTGSPWIRFNKLDTGTADFQWQNQGTNSWILRFDTTENLDFRRFVGGVYQDSTTIANATHLWTYPGSATYGSASPILTLGNNTGSPTIRQYHAAANNSRHEFYANNVQRWAINVDAAPDWTFSRYNAAGGFLDNTTIYGASHDWHFPSNIQLTAASPLFVMGSNAGAPVFRLQQSADEQGEYQIYNGAARIGSFTFGLGAPAGGPPNDYFYFRFDGAAGTSLYKRTGGAWVAIA